MTIGILCRTCGKIWDAKFENGIIVNSGCPNSFSEKEAREMINLEDDYIHALRMLNDALITAIDLERKINADLKKKLQGFARKCEE